ncbi:colicin import membrane protein [Pelomonas saccharophila]|uniref:Colicin import membrane protein n=1 Tax=Roseateles saccharophilus TaxID=304 RepID=A0ABU1YGW4_ROSSA|nr:cell envelope integrity protein TolA [Roseateles saccharophilus]MDR7267485.1 colicin import membrane protein [Roseateles saccharophilus]
MTSATLRPPEVAGMGRGLSLALVAHGLLILALSYGLNWHSDSSPAFEAELWSSVPQVAAPREEAPPEPEPEAPKPDTRAQQRAAEEAAAEQQREAEIAIAKEKKRKQEKAREEAAQLEREKAAKEAKDKAAKDKAAKEEQERAKKDKAAKDAKEAKEAKDADAKREAQRQEFLRRIQGMAGGQPNSTGTAAQNAAPSAGWVGRVKGKIRPLIIYADDGAANPTAEIQVTLGPDGRILGSKVLKASGDAEWDRAVLRAIDKAEVLPRDDGRVPPVIILTFRPRE